MLKIQAKWGLSPFSAAGVSGGKKHVERKKEENTVCDEQQVIHLAAQAAKAAAVNIKPSGDGDDDQGQKGGEKAGKEKSARTAKKAED